MQKSLITPTFPECKEGFVNDLAEDKQKKQNQAFWKEKENEEKLEKRMGIIDLIAALIDFIASW